MICPVLRQNATPLYAFLGLINSENNQTGSFQGKKILDCGAGGILPPLSVFHYYGMECWGIDISDSQLQKSQDFCQKHDMDIHLRKGDMRQIPFEDETFDYVYEHYSMCHMSRKDTLQAICEMHRVLKPGGLCFLGVISLDTWPKIDFGTEKEPGQFWYAKNGADTTVHSMFTDKEADQLVKNWQIISKEKRTLYSLEEAEDTSRENWLELYQEVKDLYSPEEWAANYSQRSHYFRYCHIYYFLRKQ